MLLVKGWNNLVEPEYRAGSPDPREDAFVTTWAPVPCRGAQLQTGAVRPVDVGFPSMYRK
jgi:hypothetical protein